MTKHDWKVGDRARVVYIDDADISFGVKVGDTVIIQEDYEAGFHSLNCTIRDDEDWSFNIVQLEPIPAETPKDPFAPGEYVTCCRNNGSQYRSIGDTVKVTLVCRNIPQGWFCYDQFDTANAADKADFRPATPEEIAGYKAKYEAEPVVDPQPEPEPRITFTVGGREFYVGQRVWVKEKIESRGSFLLPTEEMEICAISHWGEHVIARRISDMSAAMIPPYNISTTPPAPHEWKRGDWARHNEFGECFVCSGVDFAGEVRVDFVGCSASVRYETLTFIKHIDLPS